MPGQKVVDAVPTIPEVLADFSASYWLKAALRSALERDPVDAANDADILYRVLAAQVDVPLNNAPKEPSNN